MSRRYGEGSVYRKGSGWEAADYINGRRRSVRSRTMREARGAPGTSLRARIR